MRSLRIAGVLLLVSGCAQPTQRVTLPKPVAARATANPQVGGVVPAADRTIAANLAALPSLSALARAVTAAGLGATLAGTGPLTLFAPTDEAFGRLAPGTLDALLKSDNRRSLNKLLNLHLVAGRLSSAEMLGRVQAGGGHATLATVAGEPLSISLTGAVLTLTDSAGNRSYLETPDIRQANGIVHVVNGVLVPRID